MLTGSFRSLMLGALAFLKPSTLAAIRSDLSLVAEEANAEAIELPEDAQALRSAAHALIAVRGEGSPVVRSDRVSALIVWGYDSCRPGGDDFYSMAVQMGVLIAGEDGFRLLEPMPSFAGGYSSPPSYAHVVGKKFAVLVFPSGINWADYGEDGSKPLSDLALWSGVDDWQVLA